ncbi:hypothetical protein [Pseudoxanthomonas sp. UTMC 1351]|uniref:hypothetical protein n=1 Tax=Pseudoxanthomonas sp. UTMC 1351 TaxID=2695853 RepID=UPI0034CF3F8D
MKNPNWKLTVSVVLDDLERHRGEGVPTLDELASNVGVSRQTIWRHKDIVERLTAIRKSRLGTGLGTRRRTVNERIRALEAENAELREENNNLLLNFMRVAQRLKDMGVDPFKILGPGSRDPTRLSAEQLE